MPGFTAIAATDHVSAPVRSVSIVVPHPQNTSRGGPARAELSSGGPQSHGLVFAVGAAGESLSGVTVTIRDVAGCAVATLSLPSLHGLQTLIWRPGQGLAAGAYSAYWEGLALAEPG